MTRYDARKRRGSKTKHIINKSNRPRLVVYRSGKHIYSQIVNQCEQGDEVLVSSSTLDKELNASVAGNKCDQAAQVGNLLAQRAVRKNVTQVAFDRSGYKFHGRVKALAEAAREAGLDF